APPLCEWILHSVELHILESPNGRRERRKRSLSNLAERAYREAAGQFRHHQHIQYELALRSADRQWKTVFLGHAGHRQGAGGLSTVGVGELAQRALQDHHVGTRYRESEYQHAAGSDWRCQRHYSQEHRSLSQTGGGVLAESEPARCHHQSDNGP